VGKLRGRGVTSPLIRNAVSAEAENLLSYFRIWNKNIGRFSFVIHFSVCFP